MLDFFLGNDIDLYKKKKIILFSYLLEVVFNLEKELKKLIRQTYKAKSPLFDDCKIIVLNRSIKMVHYKKQTKNF